MPWALLAIVGLVVAAGLLLHAFPGRLSSREDWSQAAYGLLFLVLVATSLGARRLPLGRTLRFAAIWAGIVGVLLLVVAYRPELEGILRRVRSAVVPAYGVEQGARELVLTREQDGAFYVVGRVDGRAVTFLVDTGSSDIVLAPPTPGGSAST